VCSKIAEVIQDGRRDLILVIIIDAHHRLVFFPPRRASTRYTSIWVQGVRSTLSFTLIDISLGVEEACLLVYRLVGLP
jgi:hypothetical protein